MTERGTASASNAAPGETGPTEHVDLLVIGWGKGGKTLAGTPHTFTCTHRSRSTPLALAMRHDVTATELRNTIYTHASAAEVLNAELGVAQ